MCAAMPNGDQANLDGDDRGDACDPDDDGDGVNDDADNCAGVGNADQANDDGDAQGDACGPDDDNDGIADEFDCAQFDANVDPNSADLPDLAFTGTNCDGIDGKLSDAIFASLSGSDSATGTTPDSPKRAVNAALAQAVLSDAPRCSSSRERLTRLAAPSLQEANSSPAGMARASIRARARPRLRSSAARRARSPTASAR
jgi:thrombospondin type 3 repeat protein